MEPLGRRARCGLWAAGAVALVLAAATTAGAAGLALAAATTAGAAEPSFDCAKAEGSAQELVCRDDTLAALDRETARLFRLARDGEHMTAERKKELVAFQRGWIKGRDDCWKASDLGTCVRDEYVLRIHELRQGYADARGDDAKGISMGPKVADCPGLDALMGVTFIATDPALAQLQWLEQDLVVEQGRSGSGARYVAEGPDGETVFWVKGNGARFERPGRETLQCTIEEPG